MTVARQREIRMHYACQKARRAEDQKQGMLEGHKIRPEARHAMPEASTAKSRRESPIVGWGGFDRPANVLQPVNLRSRRRSAGLAGALDLERTLRQAVGTRGVSPKRDA
jgi:hypothetical protein